MKQPNIQVPITLTLRQANILLRAARHSWWPSSMGVADLLSQAITKATTEPIERTK